VEFHGFAELSKRKGHAGLREAGLLLQRVPESVRQQLNPGAQEAMLSPANSEIRFVAEGPTVQITLSADTTGFMFPFNGVYQYPAFYLIGPEKQTITLSAQEPLQRIRAENRVDTPFAAHVWRLAFGGWCGGPPIVFHSIEGDGLRPPRPDELPARTLLAYGTSITHGACASGPHFAYPAQAARRLGADLINFGVGGSAHCEHALSDYFASLDGWHVAVLALSVNMTAFNIDEFYERISYMVNTVAGADTTRPVFCITLYPFSEDLCTKPIYPAMKARPEEFRRKLREAVAACPHPNVHLIEGRDILDDTSGLTSDLIHPGDFGMIRMGENLAQRIAAALH